MKFPEEFQRCNEMTLSAHPLEAAKADASLEGSFLFELTTTTSRVLGNSVPEKVRGWQQHFTAVGSHRDYLCVPSQVGKDGLNKYI